LVYVFLEICKYDIKFKFDNPSAIYI
jgi:hypothetical protein